MPTVCEASMRSTSSRGTKAPMLGGSAYHLSGRFEDAMTAGNQALALAPDSVDARLVLAASLVETRRLDAAQEAVRDSLGLERVAAGGEGLSDPRMLYTVQHPKEATVA